MRRGTFGNWRGRERDEAGYAEFLTARIVCERSISLLTSRRMSWRFDNRKRRFLFRDTMLKLIASDNLEYKELTKAA